MQKINTYVVIGTHHYVPGMHMSVEFSPSAADRMALEMVATIAGDVPGAPEVPTDPSMWRSYLTDLQRTIVTSGGGSIDGEESEEELAEMSRADVTIAVVKADAPRLVVNLDGGLVQGIAGDIPLQAYVIDYDVDGADEENILEIAQEGGRTSSATMRGEGVQVDPRWIDSAVASYHGHGKATIAAQP